MYSITRLIYSGLIILLPLGLLAQVNSARIEQYALATPADSTRDILTLAHYLTAPYTKELDKVSSIFAWITHFLYYDDLAYRKGNGRLSHNAAEVLERRKGVCVGYAQLFSALGEAAGLHCQLVEGYSKGTLTARPELKTPDHAWNAVAIDGKWQLLDATWGASYVQNGNAFSRKSEVPYFLTDPEIFILDHLPGDPLWQLLDCPISTDLFQKSATDIQRYLSNTSPCFNYQDSIQAFLQLPYRQQRIAFYKNTYDFNPTVENRQQLGQAYIDLGGELADIAETLQNNGQLDSLVAVHTKLIETFRTATQFIELIDWQAGLFANTLINRAVGISRTLPDAKSTDEFVIHLEDMQELLLEAITLVDQQKPSLLQLQQISQAQEYLDWVEEQLRKYKR